MVAFFLFVKTSLHADVLNSKYLLFHFDAFLLSFSL
jgi:hypothetical protein